MMTIVTPWYGPDTIGGAETQARSLACALHSIGIDVRVWTSTGRDSFHPTEQEYYPLGVTTLDGILVRRFRPSHTNQSGIPDFFRLHPEFLPPLERFTIHEMRLLGSLLSSDELYAAIHQERSQSHFVFLPYPFPTTFWGALLAPERSFLIPCLHDEPYARYATYRYLFSQVQGVLCNSYPEAALVKRLYDLPDERIHVPGEGIDLQPVGNGTVFRSSLCNTYGMSPDSLLLFYVGKRDETKNIWLLLSYIREYWARRGTDFYLMLAGRDPIEIPSSLKAIVLDLGYIREQEKHDAYAAADLFIQPSLYESFSIVLMEAWLQSTPALVHGDCAVTVDHCQRSGGGVSFRDFGTFAAALDLLLPRPNMRQILGARGRDYVLATCNWQDVARRTASAVLPHA